MIVVDLHPILFTESCVVTGEPRFWGDVGKNVENELVWEFKNCGDG